MPGAMREGGVLVGPASTLPRCSRRGTSGGTSSPLVGSPTHQPSTQAASTPSHSRAFIRSVSQRARRVRFFRNGDPYYKGTWFAIGSDRFRALESLMEELTRVLGDLIVLPAGVRVIFSIDGRNKVSCVEDLADGESYVCASTDAFKAIDYLSAREPVWNYSVPRSKDYAATDATLGLTSLKVLDLADGESYVCASTDAFKAIDYLSAREPVWNYSVPRSKDYAATDATLGLTSLKVLDLADGESYVCASTDAFKAIDYLSAREPVWNYSVPRSKDYAATDATLGLTSLKVLDLADGESYVCASTDAFKAIDYLSAREPVWNYSVPRSKDYAATDATLGLTSLKVLDLADGESYVCTSTDAFKAIDYVSAREPVWNYSVPRSKDYAATDATLGLTSLKDALPARRDFVRPRIITVIRHGVRPRRVVRLLLNRRTAPTFRQVTQDITEAVKLDSGAVRKIFTLTGKQVVSLADFFGEDDVFIACGKERISIDDFYLASEEYKLLPPAHRGSRPGPRPISGLRSPRLPRRSQRMPSPGSRSSLGRPSPLLGSRGLRGLRNERGLSPATQHRSSSPIPEEELPPEDPTPPVEENVEPEHPDEILDMYEIGDLVGDGNFATVHQAIHRKSGEKLALKIIEKANCRGKEELVETEDVWDLPTRFYLAMELVPGGDLFDALVRVKFFEETEAASLVGNLAAALDYLHSLDIVHRDVKPENLLLFTAPDGSSQLKLADFGLAADASQPLYTVCGTPTYVCPELLSECGYGVKVDVWAMGVILYIMLCGFPPFISADNSQEELFAAILAGELSFPSPFWDPISAAGTSLVQGMLQSEVAERFSAAEVLVHPWITGEALLDLPERNTDDADNSSHFDVFGSRPSRSFFDAESVEFYSSRRRSMDDLRSQSELRPPSLPP